MSYSIKTIQFFHKVRVPNKKEYSFLVELENNQTTINTHDLVRGIVFSKTIQETKTSIEEFYEILLDKNMEQVLVAQGSMPNAEETGYRDWSWYEYTVIMRTGEIFSGCLKYIYRDSPMEKALSWILNRYEKYCCP